MKKLIFLLVLIVVATVGMARDRTGAIRTGFTTLSTPMVFTTTADTINTSETVLITISNPQKYMQYQVFTVTLDEQSGSASVAITAYGKVTSASSYVQIGDPVTLTNDGTATITATTPINYNYLKVELVASGATQHSHITDFTVKTANAYNIPANSGTLTVSRADAGTVTITSADNNADAALVVAAGGTGTLTLGDATSTTAITSSDWAIDATGVATGLGAITTNGLITGSLGATITGAAVNLNASSNFGVNVGTGTTNAAVAIGGGSNTVAVNSSDWDISTTGVVTGVGAITSDGAIISASYNWVSASQLTGTGDSLVVTNASLPTLAAGVELTLLSKAANTTTVYLNYNGTVKNIYEEGGAAPNALEANDIRSAAILKVVYDGTQWVLISPSGN